jgi:hypothetical protein
MQQGTPSQASRLTAFQASTTCYVTFPNNQYRFPLLTRSRLDELDDVYVRVLPIVSPLLTPRFVLIIAGDRSVIYCV